MNALEFLYKVMEVGGLQLHKVPVVMVDEETRDEVEVAGVIFEHGKIKLISEYTKGEAEL